MNTYTTWMMTSDRAVVSAALASSARFRTAPIGAVAAVAAAADTGAVAAFVSALPILEPAAVGC
jgi:hypothetical protein